MWQEELAELTSVSPTPDFLLSANEADGYSKAAAAAEFQEKRGLCTSMSSGQTVSQFCFLYLFMIQSASSMALLIICWILSGLSSSE